MIPPNIRLFCKLLVKTHFHQFVEGFPSFRGDILRCLVAFFCVQINALEIQNDCCRIIYKLCSGHGNTYGMIKEVLRKMGCPDCGSVRAPLAELVESDYPIADECVAMIKAAVARYSGMDVCGEVTWNSCAGQ